jgi:hypothetical protein
VGGVARRVAPSLRDLPPAVRRVRLLPLPSASGAGMTVVFAKKWAILPYYDVLHRHEPRMVIQNCAHPQQRFFCTTCNVPLANDRQLAMHEEDHPTVAHVIVKWCDRHSTYERAEPVALPDVGKPVELFQEPR